MRDLKRPINCPAREVNIDTAGVWKIMSSYCKQCGKCAWEARDDDARPKS